MPIKNTIPFNAKDEARSIIVEHTNGYMQSAHVEFDSNRDMMEAMYIECSHILTDYLLDKKYTPMQYNAVRNELASLIWNTFEHHIHVEDDNAKAAAFIASLL